MDRCRFVFPSNTVIVREGIISWHKMPMCSIAMEQHKYAICFGAARSTCPQALVYLAKNPNIYFNTSGTNHKESV